MIVDDDAEAIDLLARLLSKVPVSAGSQVSFGSAEAAIDFLSAVAHRGNELPFIAFLDVKMPQMSGLDLLDWIREHAAFDSMSVVMISSSDDPRDIQQAFALRSQAYLAKYPSVDVLRAVLKKAADAVSFGRVEGLFVIEGNLLLDLQPPPGCAPSGA